MQIVFVLQRSGASGKGGDTCAKGLGVGEALMNRIVVAIRDK